MTLNPIKLSLSTITTTRELLRAKVHDGIKTWSFWLNPASCLLRFPQPLPPFLYQGHREFPCGFLIVSSNSVSYLLSTVCRMVQDMRVHSAIERNTELDSACPQSKEESRGSSRPTFYSPIEQFSRLLNDSPPPLLLLPFQLPSYMEPQVQSTLTL